MNSLSVILLVILINTFPFVYYNYKKIKSSKFQTIAYGLLSLIISFLILKLTNVNNYYIELFVTAILTTLFNYSIVCNLTEVKKIPKSTIVISLFLLSSLFQIIPIIILNYDIDNLTSSQELLLTFISDSILLIILISIYFKTLKEDIKKFKNNFYKIMDYGIKYYLIGLVIMMISNTIILIFFNDANAVNEEGVQQLIKSSTFLSILAIGIIAPIIEELTFRKAFRDMFKNDILFIILSGVVFGSLHVILSLSSPWDLVYLIPYSSLGIAFGKIYQKSDNIYTSIFIHIVHNTVLTVISIMGVGFIL